MAGASVSITLTEEQIATVMAHAGSQTGLLPFLAGATQDPGIRDQLRDMTDARLLSQSTIRALLVLSAFPDGQERELSSLAQDVDLTPSTVYRYVTTLVAVGLLHRDPRTRRYRRAPWLAGPAL